MKTIKISDIIGRVHLEINRSLKGFHERYRDVLEGRRVLIGEQYFTISRLEKIELREDFLPQSNELFIVFICLSTDGIRLTFGLDVELLSLEEDTQLFERKCLEDELAQLQLEKKVTDKKIELTEKKLKELQNESNVTK